MTLTAIGLEHAPHLGDPQVRVGAETLPGLVQHSGALVEPGHDSTPVAQGREQRARSATSVEDPPSATSRQAPAGRS
jgi:hypothetical protein